MSGPMGQAYVGKNRLYVELDALACAQVAAYKYGFYDIDVKDNDPGSYTIVAYGDNVKVTSKGKTLEQAVESLIEKFGGKNG